jgi:hypothetical protein
LPQQAELPTLEGAQNEAAVEHTLIAWTQRPVVELPLVGRSAREPVDGNVVCNPVAGDSDVVAQMKLADLETTSKSAVAKQAAREARGAVDGIEAFAPVPVPIYISEPMRTALQG